MENIKQVLSGSFIFCVAIILLASCAGSTSSEKKAATTDTVVAKAKWINPRKGKIWDKVNIVQIPLTAIENHILGPVKSVSYKGYNVSEKDGTKTLDDSGYNAYDKFGNLVDQNEFKANGTRKWKCIYTYDNNNKILVWDFSFENPKQNSKTIFKYDDKGRKIGDSTFDKDGKYESVTYFKYDEKGNETEEITYSNRGKNKDTAVETYKYNSLGYQVENSMNFGKKMMKITAEYDKDGNSLSSARYWNDTLSGTETRAYDSKGRDTERVYYNKDKSKAGVSKDKYDDWDNVIESTTYKPDGTLDTAGWNRFTEFEYDSHGNAIKETWYKLIAGKKVMTDFEERKFDYY